MVILIFFSFFCINDGKLLVYHKLYYLKNPECHVEKEGLDSKKNIPLLLFINIYIYIYVFIKWFL